jgi:hypothetical protein
MDVGPMRMSGNALQQSALDPIKHRVMLNDGKVLGFGLELLVGILAWPEHGLLGAHLSHLLGHLIRG